MASPRYNKPLSRTALTYRKRRREIFDILGYECKDCGFTDFRALQIDHIFGGGEKERREHHGNSIGYFKHILSDPLIKEHYQILCANCNFIKLRRDEEYKRNSWSYKTGTGKEASSPSQESSIRQLTLSI